MGLKCQLAVVVASLLGLAASALAVPGGGNAEDCHVVQMGETLGKIAQVRLGAPSRWREIAKLNHIAPPYRLKVGQVLQLPPRAAKLSAYGDSVAAASVPTPAGQLSGGVKAGLWLAMIVLVAGGLVYFIGWCLFEYAAFTTGFWWGVGTMLMTPVQWVFLAKFWDKAKKGFITQMVGATVAGAGFVVLMLYPASQLFGK